MRCVHRLMIYDAGLLLMQMLHPLKLLRLSSENKCIPVKQLEEVLSDILGAAPRGPLFYPRSDVFAVSRNRFLLCLSVTITQTALFFLNHRIRYYSSIHAIIHLLTC